MLHSGQGHIIAAYNNFNALKFFLILPSKYHIFFYIAQRYRSPSTYPPQQQDTICCKYLSLMLLMMGKIFPETC